MPGGNRTGPTGQGPQTGRGLGYCGGYQAPGSATAGGRGLGGRGRGRGGGGRGQGGRGRRNMFHATGLTGWQRAAASEEAPGEPVAPPPEPPPTTIQAQPEEVAALKDQAADLSRTLQQIQDRLAALEGKVEEPTTT